MIIDDKPLALDILEDYIVKIPFLKLVYKTTNPIEGLEQIRQKKVDLVFLDIQMPELSGLDFMRLTKNKCKVILTTAYPDYALDGYEYDVVDYLLKPVSFERFYKAALKAQNAISRFIYHNDTANHNSDSIFIKVSHQIKKVSVSSILFIKGRQNYITIYTPEEKIITLQPLKSIEEKLPSSNFIRIHKSYLIAINKIDRIENNQIIINENTIPIGQKYKEAFFRKIE